MRDQVLLNHLCGEGLSVVTEGVDYLRWNVFIGIRFTASPKIAVGLVCNLARSFNREKDLV